VAARASLGGCAARAAEVQDRAVGASRVLAAMAG
jgi:hypothetical protein